MKRTTIFMFAALLGLSFLAGCQESEASQIRRARIVANENIQLKKQLEEKDQEIEELKKEIERVELEAAEEVQQAGDTSIKSMRLLLESEKHNEALILENEKLKEQLKKYNKQ